jgi:hypothetical protein
VKIDVEGNIAKPDTDYSINKSGYVIHGAIHKARPDVLASSIPTRAGMAVAAMKWAAAAVADLDPLRGPHRLSRFEGRRSISRRERLVADLRARRHGDAQPRPDLRRDDPAGVQHHVPAGNVLPGQVDAMAARTELTMPGENAGAYRAIYQPGTRRPTAYWNGPRCCAAGGGGKNPAIRPIGIRLR